MSGGVQPAPLSNLFLRSTIEIVRGGCLPLSSNKLVDRLDRLDSQRQPHECPTVFGVQPHVQPHVQPVGGWPIMLKDKSLDHTASDDMPAKPVPSPWDRQTGEPAAWCVYLSMGDPDPVTGVPSRRTLAGVARIMGHADRKTVENWAARWDWVNRATLYDAHLGRVRSAAVAAVVVSSATRMGELATRALDVLEAQLHTLGQRVLTGEERAGVGEIAGAFERVHRILALLEGKATEHVEHHHAADAMDLSRLTADQLRQLAAIRRAATIETTAVPVPRLPEDGR